MAKRYSPQLTDRAVRMVADRLDDNPSVTQWQAMQNITPKLGVPNKSLRRWHDQHLIDSAKKGRITREEHEKITRLKRNNAQSRRTNEIVKLASAFSTQELNHPEKHMTALTDKYRNRVSQSRSSARYWTNIRLARSSPPVATS